MRRSVLLPLLVSLAAPSAAGAADLPQGVTRVDAPVTRTITTQRAVARQCTARPLPGRAGVVTRTFRAPADGEVTVRLAGTGDWDLALFDRKGRLVASSAAFGATEVAQSGLRRGARLTVQACRRSGSRSARLTTRFVHLDLAAINAAATGTVSLLKVAVPSPAALESLETAGLDVTHEVGDGFATIVAYGDRDLATLRGLRLGYEVLEGDLLASDRRARAADARAEGPSLLPSGRTTYRQYADYQAELKQWVEQYPALAKPVTLKERSFQGREIQAVEISGPGDDGRPVFTLGALHHAREWPAAEAAMEFGWDLLKNGGTDPEIARVLRDVRVVIMPLTNPDGFIVSRAAPDPTNDAFGAYSLATGVVVFGGSLQYKRKNCNPLVPGAGAVLPCELAIGVDNNRNYGTKWGGPGASSNPNDQGYRGDGPFSEPETRAVQELSSKRNSPVHYSLHNVAAKVLRPPGLRSQGDTTPDRDALEELGQLVTDATGYANEVSYQLYDTTGTTKDWGYDALGQYAYTVELGPKGGKFHAAYSTNVIGEYDGKGEYEGKGLRKGLIDSALYTRRADQTSRLTGTATPGATLRITKEFTTETWPVCTIADPTPVDVAAISCVRPGSVIKVPEKIDITTEVPADGSFEWWLNPSTRPFVEQDEAYTLTCEVNGITRHTQQVVARRGQAHAVALDGC